MRIPVSTRGFTLIELLVVIAIIAVLAAILFPVFARAREKARQSTCQSNQRQIAAAITMYAQDHEETLPDAASVWGAIQIDQNVLICPTAGKSVPNGYVYNNLYAGQSIGKIDDPSNSSLIMDGISTPTAASGVFDQMYGNVAYTPDNWDPRHTNKVISSYVDGHVSIPNISPQDLSAPPFVPGTPIYPSSKDVNMAFWNGTVMTASTGTAANMNKPCVSSYYVQYGKTPPIGWFQAQLPYAQRINRIRMRWWGGQRPGSFRVWVMNKTSEQSTTSPVINYSGTLGGYTVTDFNLSVPLFGKYVYILLDTAQGTDGNVTLDDLDIYTLTDKAIDGNYPVSDALSGKVTLTNESNWASWESSASSSVNPIISEISHFTDYTGTDNLTRPAVKQGQTGTLKFTFPQTYTFTKVIYGAYSGAQKPSNVVISFSNDDVTYTPAYTGAPANGQNTATIASVKAKYARLTATSSNAGGSAYDSILARIAFYGTP